MSEYKGIKGFRVTTRTEDPAPFAQALADNPYAGSWASGGSLNTARTGVGGGAVGTQTASITAGGNTSGATAVSEQYNGTSWTETNDLNVARYDFQKFGTSTAALHCGGEGLSSPPYPQTTAALVESWNGSSWTETTDMPAAKRNGGGAGTSTSGLVYGGNATPAAPRTAASYEWDGSSWTAGGDMNTTRRYFGSYGTQTAAQAVSGDTPPYATQVEQYNGSSWTEIAEVNTARAAVAGNGTTTSALVYGGNNGSIRAFTESWDGSSWTEVADLATAVQYHGSGGANNLSGLSFGGGTPSNTAATEEWTFSGVQPTDAASYANAITGDFYYNSTTGQFKNNVAGVGSWSSGGDMNTARYHSGGAGNSNSAVLAYLGYTNPSNTYTVNNEDYNGTAWTEVANLNVGAIYAGGTGSNTAAIECGGNTDNPSNYSATTEVWNGTSWTEVNDLNKGRNGVALFGTSTAAIGASGYQTSPDSYSTAVESWDGTSWTEIAEVNYGKYGASAAGTVATAGIVMGGENPGMPAEQKNTESWDGSSWTEVGDMNQGRSWTWSGGSSTDAVAAGGQPPSVNTETWDGTSWTEVNNLAAARGYAYGKCGTSGSNSIYAGGVTSPPGLSGKLATTEEWTKPDFQIKSVTTS